MRLWNVDNCFFSSSEAFYILYNIILPSTLRPLSPLHFSTCCYRFFPIKVGFEYLIREGLARLSPDDVAASSVPGAGHKLPDRPRPKSISVSDASIDVQEDLSLWRVEFGHR